METQDFSFPKINETCIHIIDSPPLWNLSQQERDEKEWSKGQRKSFSSVQGGKKETGFEDEEVSMDLLWEVFNEELSSKTKFSTTSSRELVEFKCTTALTIAKTNSAALLQSKNRPNMMVIVRVLKKLFSVNNSQGNPTRRIL